MVCNDPGCKNLINNVDLLRCDSPGCYLAVSQLNFSTCQRDLLSELIKYRLTCGGLVEKPTGGSVMTNVEEMPVLQCASVADEAAHC